MKEELLGKFGFVCLTILSVLVIIYIIAICCFELDSNQISTLTNLFVASATFIAACTAVLLFTDWKEARKFDLKVKIYEDILKEIENLRKVLIVQDYFFATQLKKQVDQSIASIEPNIFSINNNYQIGHFRNHLDLFSKSFIKNENTDYVVDIYSKLLIKSRVLFAINKNSEISKEIGNILSAINTKRSVQYTDLIDKFNLFDNRKITLEQFKNDSNNLEIFNKNKNLELYQSVLTSCSNIYSLIQKDLDSMME